MPVPRDEDDPDPAAGAPVTAGGAKRDAWRDPRVAAEYEARRFRGPLARIKHRRDAALVLSILRRAPAVQSVLDLPAGTGRLLPALGAAGYRAVGADVSAAMLEVARRALPADLPLARADAERLPFAAGAFDAVVCVRFLFHVSDPATRCTLLREMARVTAVLVVGEVAHRGTLKHLLRRLRGRLGAPSRCRRAPGRAEIARELAAAGLDLERLVPVSRLFSDKAFFVARPRRPAP
ncbi:MAG: class I SAM-dependent methyltransferase [Planctomycetota bacterium]